MQGWFWRTAPSVREFVEVATDLITHFFALPCLLAPCGLLVIFAGDAKSGFGTSNLIFVEFNLTLQSFQEKHRSRHGEHSTLQPVYIAL
jgi:hypothetical protein